MPEGFVTTVAERGRVGASVENPIPSDRLAPQPFLEYETPTTSFLNQFAHDLDRLIARNLR